MRQECNIQENFKWGGNVEVDGMTSDSRKYDEMVNQTDEDIPVDPNGGKTNGHPHRARGELTKTSKRKQKKKYSNLDIS